MPKLAGLTFFKMSKQNIIKHQRHCIKTNKRENPKFKMTFCMLILIFVLFKSTVKDVFSDNRKTFCELSCTSEMLANLHNISDRKNRLNKLHSSYHILLIILSNDVQMNPGPKLLNNCKICNDNISVDLELVKCQTCKQLYHLKCLMPQDINSSFEWICVSRHCKPNHQSLPVLANVMISPNRYNSTNQNIKPQSNPGNSVIFQESDTDENLKFLRELTRISPEDYVGKDLCRQCYKPVKDNQAAILCDMCDYWSHRLCCNISTKAYNELKLRGYFAWSCCKCRTDEPQIRDKINIKRLSKDIIPDPYNIVQQRKDETLILHINCRSLLNKREELEDIIEQLKPNILCLTETWFDGSVSPKEFVPDGYKIIRHDRTELFKTKYGKNNGGGVAILYKEHIKIQKISVITDDIEEILWIRVKTKFNFLLGVLYRPVYTDMMKIYKEESFLESNLRTACETAKNIILLGDFNINYLDKNDHLTEKLEDICTTNSLSQQILKPTRMNVHTGSKTLIDHIWTNQECVPVKSAGTCLGLSDHLATYIKINTRMESEEKTITYRDYKEYNAETFCNTLKNYIESSDIYNIINIDKNVNQAMETLSNIITRTLDQFAPIKERKIKRGFNPIPWYNSDLKDLIAQKNGLLKDFYQYGLDILKKPIKKINNKIVHLKRKLKSKYLTSKLASAQNNPKEYWKIINSIIGTSKENDTVEPDMMTQSKADEFNHFFANIGEGILKELNLHIPPTELKGMEGFSFSHETEEAVSKLIDNIKSNVATGQDGISSQIIKESKHVIAPIMTKIINLGYDTNCFPNSMKEAVIKPLHKKEDTNIISNYRPISILPCLSKIFEKSAANQLTKYLENQNLISACQHAYRKQHGTTTCLFQIINYVQKLLDDKKLVAIVSLDLSKAFDAINHEMLLAKLIKLGLSESALLWIKSYLSGRKQRTRFSNYTSKEENVKAGVPQGSILGPLLFICFSNDLYAAFENKCKAYSYADDSQLILYSKSQTELKHKIEDIIKVSHSWYSSNCMKANQGKTEILIINTRNIRTEHFKIKVKENGKVKNITPSKTIKILGIMIDENLHWKKQVLYVKKHATNTIRKLHRINHLLPIEVRIQLYLSLVVPHFDYCDIIWGGCTSESASKLQVTQNFAIRSITGAKKQESASESFRKLKFLKLNQRRKIHEVVFSHKSLIQNHPNEICQMYIKQCPTSNTRSSTSAVLNYPQHKTSKYETSPFYRTISSWNSIPAHICTNTTTKAFKNQFQKHIIATTYSQN